MKNKKRDSIILITFFLILFFIMKGNVYSVQSSYQFSPPPIPWFEFEEGQKDTRAGGTFLYMTGEVDADEYSGNVNVYGLGGNVFYRNAIRDKFALDIGASAVYASGEIGPAADMELGILSIPFGLEFQPVKTPDYVLILFAGFNLTWTKIKIQVEDGSDEYDLTMKSSIKGPQWGLQFSIKRNDFVFSPFFMMTKLSGTADIEVNENGYSVFSGSISVPSTTAKFYGLDIVYVPSNITLSSLVQQLSASGGNKGFKTYVLCLTYNFHTPGDNKVQSN